MLLSSNGGGGSVPTMNIVGQTSLSIVELAGGNDGPSGPQGPTGPQAPIAPASAIRVSLDINASSEFVASPDGLQFGRGNTTIENEQRYPNINATQMY